MAFTKILGPGIHTLANFHSHNINSSGIITATKFVGDMEPGGGTGSFDSLTVTGNLGVGGTVTYTDVTNVDAVGIITAQSGIYIGAGATVGSFNTTTGISSFKTLNVDETSTLNGSVGIADSIIHIGNTDTSIRFPSDDTFTVETGGSERLRVRSDGGIQIGNDPSNLAAIGSGPTLGINGAAPEITLRDTATNNPYAWIATNDAGSLVLAADQGDNANSSIIDFRVDGSEKLRIQSNGRIGIGTNDPLGVAHINVGGGTTEPFVIERLGNGDQSSIWSLKPFGGGLYFRGGKAVGNYSSDRFAILYGGDNAYGGDVAFFGATAGITSCLWDASANTLIFNDNVKAAFGSDQDAEIYHNGSSGFYLNNSTGNFYIRSGGGQILMRPSSSYDAIVAKTNEVELYYNSQNHSTPKLTTSATGITVDGEVAASQDYPNIRPVLDFNFAATKKLKPEMTFTRTGEASFHDGVGSVKFVSDNEPRFEHDIVTGECKGVMFEAAGTNYSWYSRTFDSINSGSWVPQNGGATPTVTANTHTAPDGTSSGAFMADTISGATGTAFNGNVVQQQHTAGANVKHTFSMYIKLITSTQATIYIRDGATGSVSSASAIPNTRNWQRVVVTSSAALTNSTVHGFYIGNTNGTIAVWGSQIERSDYVSSYIKTVGGANGTRTADDGGVRLDGEDVTDIFNQGEGTLIAELIPTLDETNQTAVGFYQDFGSVNRVELRAQGTNTANARFESVVGSSSVATMTGSAHAGVNNVSKYAFAFQENNYASTVNGGTVQTDTSGAFPHGTGINSMIIGDSVYSKDQSMIIKRIMYYADRLPDSQLVTLTS